MNDQQLGNGWRMAKRKVYFQIYSRIRTEVNDLGEKFT